MSFIQDFEDILVRYPKKEAKGFAKNAWLLLRKKGELSALAELQKFIKQVTGTESWQCEQGRFITQIGKEHFHFENALCGRTSGRPHPL